MASTTYIYTVKNTSDTNLTPACVLYSGDKETVLKSEGQTTWEITNTLPSALSPCYIFYDDKYYKIESSDWIQAGGTTFYVNIDNQTPEDSGDSPALDIPALGKIYLGGILISDPLSGIIKKADSQPTGGMLPNVFYSLGTISGATTMTMAAASDNTKYNEWMFQFSTGSSAPTITWDSKITAWLGGSAPTINANKTYQVSVVDGLGIIAEF